MGITIKPAALSGLAIWTETGRVFLPLTAENHIPEGLHNDLERLLGMIFQGANADSDGWGDQSEED